MVGREAVIEKLTWKMFLENKVSQETRPEDTEELLPSLASTGSVRKKIIKYLSISCNGREEFCHLFKIKATLLIYLSHILNRS